MSSFRMAARSEVEAPPEFELLEPGWHDVILVGVCKPIQSQYALKYGEREGQFPWNTAFRYELVHEQNPDGSPKEKWGRWFDMENPYDKRYLKEASGILGRELGDNEDFEIEDHMGKRLQILIVHEETKQGQNKGKIKDAVDMVRPPKPRQQQRNGNRPPRNDDFPEDPDF